MINRTPQLASTGSNEELLQSCSGQIAMSFVVTFDWGKWHKLSMSSRLHFDPCTHLSPSQGRRFFKEENKSLKVSWISPFVSDISLIRSAIQGWVMIHSAANTHRKRLKESRHWKGGVSLFLALRIKARFEAESHRTDLKNSSDIRLSDVNLSVGVKQRNEIGPRFYETRKQWLNWSFIYVF